MTSDGGRKYEKGVFSFASSGCLYECALFPSLATAKHQRWRGGYLGDTCAALGVCERFLGAVVMR